MITYLSETKIAFLCLAGFLRSVVLFCFGGASSFSESLEESLFIAWAWLAAVFSTDWTSLKFSLNCYLEITCRFGTTSFFFAFFLVSFTGLGASSFFTNLLVTYAVLAFTSCLSNEANSSPLDTSNRPIFEFWNSIYQSCKVMQGQFHGQ